MSRLTGKQFCRTLLRLFLPRAAEQARRLGHVQRLQLLPRALPVEHLGEPLGHHREAAAVPAEHLARAAHVAQLPPPVGSAGLAREPQELAPVDRVRPVRVQPLQQLSH